MTKALQILIDRFNDGSNNVVIRKSAGSCFDRRGQYYDQYFELVCNKTPVRVASGTELEMMRFADKNKLTVSEVFTA